METNDGQLFKAGASKTDNSSAQPTSATAQPTVIQDAASNKPMKVNSGSRGGIAIVLSGVALLLGLIGMISGLVAVNKVSTPITFLGGGNDGNSANFTEGSIADIADKVSESVVSIVTSTKATDFFGQDREASAAGTGIIVTSDGYILTNKHVINGASKVSVILDDGTKYDDVEIVAVDPLNDVAFLKIKDVSELKPATLGDSKTIHVGQQVIAIGNALGEYQNTVTAGIISGTGRSVTASDGSGRQAETLTDMIQTDAAINSGNSGGPLVNAAGEVIGINTATSSTAENMGFAIPISSAKGMLKQLVETGKAERTYLGVYTVEITPEAAKEYSLPVNSGAYIYSSSAYTAVTKDSPAEKAGLKDKDIITHVNGTKVGSAGSLSSLIGEYKPGDTVQLTVIREGNEIAINATLGGYPTK
ncbi:trypsin-like peptidase domain-containing protein [Candidatus Saccharibacteria bacterium]|nr:trypsin-like peptidase domain-containing protein [Candidatus Saccharibacteria bacterium]